uniref:Uncharacterized protein n=1 Tax=Glossina austeni TaxID=7395 RepID=A0A1A9UHI0_GLOAU
MVKRSAWTQLWNSQIDEHIPSGTVSFNEKQLKIFSLINITNFTAHARIPDDCRNFSNFVFLHYNLRMYFAQVLTMMTLLTIYFRMICKGNQSNVNNSPTTRPSQHLLGRELNLSYRYNYAAHFPMLTSTLKNSDANYHQILKTGTGSKFFGVWKSFAPKIIK